MAGPSVTALMNRLVLKAKIRHLVVLVRLAELGSMRSAAKSMNMAQPAISQLVAELEALLETQLFFRHARGVEPTAVGKDLLPIAQRILQALRDGVELISNRADEQDGLVRVAASYGALGGMVEGMLDAFAQSYPSIHVSIVEITQDGMDVIADGSADIVCMREPAVIPSGWDFHRCLEDAIVTVCGRNHPLARSVQPTLAELGQHKWLTYRAGSSSRTRFDQIADQAHWPASARCQVVMHIPKLTRQMLETGHYLSAMPRSVALPWLQEGSVVELSTAITQPMAPLGFLIQEDKAGAAAAKFAAHLKRDAVRRSFAAE